MIDAIISNDTCSVHFDQDGDLCDRGKKVGGAYRNLLQCGFTKVLMDAWPKEVMV